MNLIKFIYSILLLISFNTFSQEEELMGADSLFYNENYTESKKIYDSIFYINKYYSESMLLKMAVIEEKLNNYEKSIYYLSIIQRKNSDKLIQEKINKIILKNELDTYDLSDKDYLNELFLKYKSKLLTILITLISLIFTANIFIISKNNKPNFFLKGFYILSFLTLVIINYKVPRIGIVSDNNTFIMNEPSSASDVFMIIKKGEKLKITNNNIEAWYEVSMNNKKKFIRKKNLYIVD